MRRRDSNPRTRLLVLTLAGLLGGAVEGRADLHFTAVRVDVGEIRSGAKLGHAFAFRNEGPEVVEIIEARPGCGCLRPSLERHVFRPGEGGTIPVEVNARGQSAGPHTWRLQLLYRDGGTEREATLEVTARVVTEVTLQPAALTLVAEGPVAQEIVLTDLRPRPLRVKQLMTSAPHLRAAVAAPYRDGLGQWVQKIRLEFTGDCPDGRHNETLILYTDDPVYPDLQVPITLVKRPRARLTATPERVALVLAPGQATASRLVRIGDRQGEKVVVEDVKADDPAITCSWAPGPDHLATVKVQVDRGRVEGGAVDSTLRVRLSGPVRETVTLPVRCTVESATR